MRMAKLLGSLLTMMVGQTLGASAQDFYKGKVIEIIVPGPPGGGPSDQARIFSDYVTKHVAGSPRVIIRNMPGGGGVQALNYMAEIAKPDGLTFFWGPIQFTGALIKSPGYRYDPGSFDPVGTSSLSYVVLANTKAGKGVRSFDDFMKLDEFVFGGFGRGRAIDFLARTSFNLLGLKHKYVLGYHGQPDIALALQRQEVDVSISGHTGYVTLYEKQLVEAGVVTPLYYHSPIDSSSGEPMRVREGTYPKSAPNFIDALKNLGKNISGAEWDAYKWVSTYETWPAWFFAPKGTTPAALSQMRAGFNNAIKDPALIAAWKYHFNEEPTFIEWEAARKLQSGFQTLSTDAIELIKNM